MSINQIRVLLGVTTILGLGMAAPAMADSVVGGSESETAAQADDTTASTGDIVVTAQRREELQRDVPISITALNEEMLSKAGVTNTVELAKVTPGLALPFYGAFILPSIRGISSSGAGLGDSPNVAIYVDGVYQASQSGSPADLPDVQSIQVLKGPQGALYGQNAAGGAIIIDTFAPSFDLTGKVTFGYGKFNDMTMNGYVSGPLSDQLAVSLAGAYRNRDGVNRDVLRGGHDEGLRSHLIRGKVLWQPSDGASLTLSGFYSRRNDSGVYSGPALAGNSLGVFLTKLPCNFGGFACLNLPVADQPHEVSMSPPADTRIRTWGTSLLGKFEIGELGTLNTVSSYKNTEVLNLLDLDATPVNTAGVYLEIKERDYIQEVNFTSRKFGGLTVSAGLFFLDKVERYTPNLTIFYPGLLTGLPTTAFPSTQALGVSGTASKATKTSYAGFLELDYAFTEQLTVTLGGRYSHEKQKVFSSAVPGNWQPGDPLPAAAPDPRGSFTFEKFTPRAVLRFKPSADHTLYASYSRGFKSGYVNPGNVNTSCAPGCVDPPVKPEVVDAYEVGYKGKLAGVLDISVAAFHYLYKDIQVFIYNPPPQQSLYQNAASGKINGAEFSANFRATPELTFNFGGSYLDAKYKSFPAARVYEPSPGGTGNTVVTRDASGNRLMRTPKWTLSGSINYEHEFSAGEVGAFVGANYNSGFFFDSNNRVSQPEYALLDAELSFSPAAFPGMRLAIWGKNLTDKAVLQSTLENPFGDLASYADPRTYGVRIEYRF